MMDLWFPFKIKEPLIARIDKQGLYLKKNEDDNRPYYDNHYKKADTKKPY